MSVYKRVVCWQGIWSKKEIDQSEGGYVINAVGLA